MSIRHRCVFYVILWHFGHPCDARLAFLVRDDEVAEIFAVRAVEVVLEGLSDGVVSNSYCHD